MQSELAMRRRALGITYRRYIEADLAWHTALEEMRVWFPPTDRPNRAAMGNPGSEMRRIYEARARALVQLEAARQKLETARRRLARRAGTGGPRLVLIAG